ncbi:MFS transporter [Paenibacillus radicis (ex Xue et al. 2023)]|uniref:MFS transporter n=1 Tax=Paenibacillus radicis (ex Xue et al. 2023) TaxID=2972489 RepID=A0ABT1YB11_9BACL|nr:MFS transporter [Paenibacillus radicis (ex Xue et al. 2023)]MCR8630383.1 MFS transporter [Paenibacillus radicis (ex Xue et al. 2023)]
MSSTQSIFGPRYLALSIGIILAVMAVGFEGLAVTTVAPAIANDLKGITLYGWIFSAYLLAQIIGTLVVGRLIDRKGPALPFTVAIILFVIGLIAAAVANDMMVLIASRALQGFGAGAMMTCVYTAISLSYPDELRPKILGAFGTAYVLPSMIGPYVAGVIAQQFSWRFVFWGVLPFLVLAAFLSLPVFRKLKFPNVEKKSGAGATWLSILLAIGTGIFLSGLGMLPKTIGIVLVLVGLALMVQPLRKLLPAGTLKFRLGLPSLIASRGLFFAAYVSTQNFLVLALTETKGLTADLAGLIVASAALSWCVVSYMQSHWDAADQGRGRNKRIRMGVSLMIIGIGIVVWVPAINIALSIIGQMITGIGIGLAHPTSGAVAFANAKEGESGEVSANLQFADSFTPGIVIGIGGAIIAVSQATGLLMEVGISGAMVLNLGLIIFSLFASTRLKMGKSVGKTVV